jgi:hypothetical protein
MVNWSAWKQAPNEPLPNPTAALTLRLYDHFPELAPRRPTPEALHRLLTQILGRPVPLTELAVLLGREKTSGFRWKARGEPSLPVSRLIEVLQKLLESHYLEGFTQYRQLVLQEAAMRGIPDLLRAGIWKPTEPN